MKRSCLLLLLFVSISLLSCGKKETQPAVNLPPAVSMVTTFAGNGSLGHADGPRANASFTSPIGLVMDNFITGNLYVSDANMIRSISKTGEVSTLAGKFETGATDGKGSNAGFDYPRGLAVDQSGNIYVADYGNNKIRKITPAGDVTTLAGSGAKGTLDGQGVNATFELPTDITIDVFGNLYVADTFNHRIRKITPTGNVTTLAGNVSGLANGPVATASFSAPYAIALDAAGSLYIADISGTIRKLSSSLVSTFAGSSIKGSLDGTGTDARFMIPAKIIIDAADNLYVSDEGDNKIRKITPSGIVSTLAGSGKRGLADGEGTTATFNGPVGLAIDPTGNVFVAEPYNRKIRKITPIKP